MRYSLWMILSFFSPLFGAHPLDSLLKEGVEQGAFPGGVVLFQQWGALPHVSTFGTIDGKTKVSLKTRYDLASLTKPFATTLALMKLYEKDPTILSKGVSSFLKDFPHPMTLEDLLSHRSGLPADTPRDLYDDAEAIWEFIYTTPLLSPPGSSTLYSDLGYILLGKIVEEIAGEPLDSFLYREVYAPLKLSNISFSPSNGAPTEHGLVGRVHDEKAHALGVCGHAGLFSDIYDLAKLVDLFFTEGGEVFSKDTIEHFFQYRHSEEGFCLGFRKDPVRNLFYHTGFTGPCVYMNFEKGWYLIVLTNRVFPSRDNYQILQVRRDLIDYCTFSFQDSDHIRA